MSSIYNVEFYLLGNFLIVLSLPRVPKKFKYGLILFILLYFIIERSEISGTVSMIFIMSFVLISFSHTLIQEIRLDGKLTLFLPGLILLYFVGIVLAYYYYADIILVQKTFLPKIILYTSIYCFVTIVGPDKKINFTFGYDPSIKAKMANDMEIHVDEYDDYLNRGLSHREIQISMLIKKGLNNKEIAETLNIEKKTVETHMQNMKVKFGFDSVTELRDFVKKADEIDVSKQD
ncbi:MAG: helix-turn-helix transcriptional regulator [Ignavibacteria bacterium]|nr:helix-turn-helix transcriptional regulator [Ignavibacteria bacterium]